MNNLSLSLSLSRFIYFMGMSVLLICMYMYHMHAWCLRKSEEVRHLLAAMWVLGTKLDPL